MNYEGCFHPESDDYKYWTKEEEDKLKSLVETSKYSFKDIGLFMKRSGQSCQDHSCLMGLKSSFVRRKYSVNHSFWKIPNLLNSYYAGFSAADASIKGPVNTYRLEIQKSDEPWLENFKRDIEFNGPIATYDRRETRNSITSCIHVTSRQWIEDLELNFSVIPNKTHRLQPPRLDNLDLIMSWFIGYTDGDGCIFHNKANNQIGLNYVSSSESIIKYVNSIVDDNFKGCLTKKDNNYKKNKIWQCWGYRVSGIKAAVIINYLSQFPVPKLARKWQNPQVWARINDYKEKYPGLFSDSPSQIENNDVK
jgi:hypothetical protein